MKNTIRLVGLVSCLICSLCLAETLYVESLFHQDVITPNRQELVPVALNAISRYQPQVALDDLTHGTIHYKLSEFHEHHDEHFAIRFYIDSETVMFDDGWKSREVKVRIRKAHPMTSDDVSIVRVETMSSSPRSSRRETTQVPVDQDTILRSRGPLLDFSGLTTPDRKMMVRLALEAIEAAFPELDQDTLQFFEIACRTSTGDVVANRAEYYSVSFWVSDTVQSQTNEDGVVTINGISVASLFMPGARRCRVTEDDLTVEIRDHGKFRTRKASGRKGVSLKELKQSNQQVEDIRR